MGKNELRKYASRTDAAPVDRAGFELYAMVVCAITAAVILLTVWMVNSHTWEV